MTYKRLYEDALYKLEHNKITLGEFEEMTKPLDREVEQEPILDKVKQAREEIENLNLNDYGDNLYQFQAKCTEILDKLIESEGT